MTQEDFRVERDHEFYRWSDDLNVADYIHATYEVSVRCGDEAAATAMAIAQSAGHGQASDGTDTAESASNCVRVVRVSELFDPTPVLLSKEPPSVPDDCITGAALRNLSIELAVPLRLLAGKPAQLFNIFLGAVSRIRQVAVFRLVSANLPADFGPGAGFGLAGMRQLAQQPSGPLLCRSITSADGSDMSSMVQRSFDALVGGIHIAKDHELAAFANFAEFKQHVRAMISARDAARAKTSGQKLYIANLICEPWELSQRWDLCCYLGVDGVFVAPWLQGWGTLSYLARQRKMPILAENTLGELFLAQNFGGSMDDSVLTHWLQVLGADFFFSNGQSASHKASTGLPTDQCRSPSPLVGIVPVLRGENSPDNLVRCREMIGSDDFLLIADY